MTMPKRSDFITEDKLITFFGMTRDNQWAEKRLSDLRQKESMPFIKIGRATRMYYLPDIFDWLHTKKTVLGSETENEES